MFRTAIFYLSTAAFFFHAEAALSSGFFTQAELLYWQAEEGGLTYALEGPSLAQLRGKNLSFEWDVGFNVGIGYRIPHDQWQLLLQFTSLQTHADARNKGKNGNVFFPSWLSSDSPISLFASEVKAHWRLHLGLIDALLSKSCPATKTFTLTPQIGIRWGSIRQKFNIAYFGGNFLPEENILIRMKNKFQGLGPIAALGSEYAFCKSWSLFAKAAASLLYGQFYLHQDEDTLGTKEKLLGLHSIFRSISPILEGTAGIRWQHRFNSSLKRLVFDIAWDQLLFFSQNQLVHLVSSQQPGITVANQGDLSIAGVHFKMGFDF